MPKKPPGPVYTLQPVTPAKPSWWQAHRHQVLATIALIVGFLLGQNANAPAATTTPPAHTTPADSTSPSTP